MAALALCTAATAGCQALPLTPADALWLSTPVIQPTKSEAEFTLRVHEHLTPGMPIDEALTILRKSEFHLREEIDEETGGLVHHAYRAAPRGLEKIRRWEIVVRQSVDRVTEVDCELLEHAAID